ncbi:phage baseplate assembly protein domain-containing protein [Acinetobacter sp. ANC 5502]
MIDAIRSQIGKAASQVRQSFLGIVARGSAKALQLKGFADEVLTDTELYQQVGFSSFIPEGAKVVVIPLQGKTAKSIVVATSGGNIVVNVAEGETCVYDQFGHSLWLKEEGVRVKGGDFFVDDGNLHVVKGNVFDQKGSMQEMRDTYNEHTNGNSPQPSPKM